MLKLVFLIVNSDIDKKKAISSIHRKLEKIDGNKLYMLDLDVRSSSELGKKLSSYQISYNGEKVESIYHSCKIFENGGPYQELAKMLVSKVLNDSRLTCSGNVLDFCYEGEFWGQDRGFFYDFLYIIAVKDAVINEELKKLLKYDYFTDIECKHSSEKNSARAVAIIKHMIKQFGEIPKITKNEFVKYCKIFVDI